mmetsp:Transcript_48237/g.126108  ORF Transcript_48237/g.126108 Transcript_48237/m.126108 type:complete len:211 (-) Transcript_48237:186-818(-)
MTRSSVLPIVSKKPKKPPKAVGGVALDSVRAGAGTRAPGEKLLMLNETRAFGSVICVERSSLVVHKWLSAQLGKTESRGTLGMCKDACRRSGCDATSGSEGASSIASSSSSSGNIRCALDLSSKLIRLAAPDACRTSTSLLRVAADCMIPVSFGIADSVSTEPSTSGVDSHSRTGGCLPVCDGIASSARILVSDCQAFELLLLACATSHS